MPNPFATFSETDKQLLAVILLCLLIVFLWHSTKLKAVVDDVIRDKDTKHVVARDLQKFGAFVLACLLAVAVAVANLVFKVEPASLLFEIILSLLAYSGGLQYIKARQVASAGLPPTGASEPPPGPGPLNGVTPIV